MTRRAGLVLLALVAAIPALIQAQTPAPGAQAADAGQVLADLRAALGGTERLAAVKTLTAEGVVRRVTPRGTIERTIALSVERPDKYVARLQLTDQGNMSVYRRTGFNGDGVINETDAPPNLSAAGRSRLTSDRPLAAATPEQQAAAAQRVMMTAKKDFARLAFVLFGASEQGYPVEFSYAGLAESPDGSAHVIEARGADDFVVRLFADATTHRPLMAMWTETRPANPRAAEGTPAASPATLEHRLFYSDFKAVGGVLFPRTWRHAVDGNVTEETTWSEVKVNPRIDARTFAVSK